MRIYQYTPLVNGDMTGDLSSSAWQLNQSWGCGVSCVVTNESSVGGTLTILGSIDNVNFTPLKESGTNVTLTVAANGTFLFDVFQTSCQYLKVTYTAAAGTGTLNITVFSKGY